jgi:ATP-dependent Lon protease
MAGKTKTQTDDPDDNPFEGPWALGDNHKTMHDTPTDDPATDDNTTNPPRWRVFSPPEAAALLSEAENESEFGKGPVRYDWLCRMINDPDRGMRSLILPDTAIIDGVETLRQSAPHLEPFLDVVLPSLGAAQHTRRPLELPPVLLLGPPGVGKTHVARELAKAIGMPTVSLSMPNQSTTNVFAGRDMSWKSPAIGVVARTLIANTSASPLIILDEIDKTAGRHTEFGDTLGPLHDLLEPSTAQAFEDELLKVRFDASRICWIATANDLAPLPPSLVDRFLVIEIPAPGEQHMHAVLHSLYADLIAKWDGWFVTELPWAVAQALRQTHPRKARQTLSLAMTIAANRNCHILEVEDIANATRILSQNTARRRMGFV